MHVTPAPRHCCPGGRPQPFPHTRPLALATPQALAGRVAALTEVCEAMAGQLAECYAATAAQLPMRLSELEGRVQATAQTTADVVKVRARGLGTAGRPWIVKAARPFSCLRLTSHHLTSADRR